MPFFSFKDIVELDEKYIRSELVKVEDIKSKLEKHTTKQWLLTATLRRGSVQTAPILSEKTSTVQPLIDKHSYKSAQLMSDKCSYKKFYKY